MLSWVRTNRAQADLVSLQPINASMVVRTSCKWVGLLQIRSGQVRSGQSVKLVRCGHHYWNVHVQNWSSVQFSSVLNERLNAANHAGNCPRSRIEVEPTALSPLVTCVVPSWSARDWPPSLRCCVQGRQNVIENFVWYGDPGGVRPIEWQSRISYCTVWCPGLSSRIGLRVAD